MKNLQSTAFVALLLICFTFSAFSQKMKPEEILAKHIDSIGTSAARSAEKNRIMVGDLELKTVTQRTTPVKGRIVLASSGNKMFLGLSTDSANYPSEKFSFDGKDAKVGFARVGVRSILGNFVSSNKLMLEESLLGGTLSSSWALLKTNDKKFKLINEGIKKIDGKEAYALGYGAKSDLNITLYFDKETFRHVRTEYKRTSSAGIGTSPDQSSRYFESRFKITEDFSDFKDESGLMLPHNYKLNYSIAGQNGTTEIQWDFAMYQFAFNQNLAESTFDAEAVN